jgi:AraC-like DNA-binding protein
MHAHFTKHVYHRHSHETYSFGVTEEGAQAFTCRRARHVSGPGLVMAFNPDDPHDGHAGNEAGFTYRMIHLWPGYYAGILDGPRALPLFRDPVIDDPALARALAADCSRYAAYRVFSTVYGMPPSDYQRQLRLRAARGLLAAGVAPAIAAARAGFADQAHLVHGETGDHERDPGQVTRGGDLAEDDQPDDRRGRRQQGQHERERGAGQPRHRELVDPADAAAIGLPHVRHPVREQDVQHESRAVREREDEPGGLPGQPYLHKAAPPRRP